MNFAIVWTGPALTQLAEVWLQATDQVSVMAASHRIEDAILADPLGAGESRDADERIVFDPPLVVMYTADRDRATAFVTDVALSRRYRP